MKNNANEPNCFLVFSVLKVYSLTRFIRLNHAMHMELPKYGLHVHIYIYIYKKADSSFAHTERDKGLGCWTPTFSFSFHFVSVSLSRLRLLRVFHEDSHANPGVVGILITLQSIHGS